MGATSVIKLSNRSGIPDVFFRGTTVPPGYSFQTDVDDGGLLTLHGVAVGHYQLVASRIPGGTGLASIEFDVSETMGIGAVLIPDPKISGKYLIVVECFVITPVPA
jgi:hypothetical protein